MTSTTDPYGKWDPLHCVKSIPKWEDPCPFWDEDGKAYLVRSQHGAGPIIVHLQPMTWSEDGWPVIGVDIDRNGIGNPVTVCTKPIAGGKASAPASSDDFSSSSLSYQWQFNHNPVDGAWRIDSKRHVLQLDALESSSFRTARNTVTQKVMGFKSQATVALDVSEIADGQRCGLAAMGHMNMMLGVRRENGKTELYNSDDKTETVLCQVKKNVILRIDYDMDAQRFQFSYSLDGKKFVDAGEPFYLRFGFWKGARTALYSYNVTGAAGRASFSNFVYVHDGPSK